MPAVSIYLTEAAFVVWKDWPPGTRSRRLSDFIMRQSLKSKIRSDSVASMPNGGYTNFERIIEHNQELVDRINELLKGISENTSSRNQGEGLE